MSERAELSRAGAKAAERWLLAGDPIEAERDPATEQQRLELEQLRASHEAKGSEPWTIQTEEGPKRDVRVRASYERMRGDLYVLTRWREVGYDQAALEACSRWGHLRPRGGICDRCGGAPRRDGHHERRERREGPEKRLGGG